MSSTRSDIQEIAVKIAEEKNASPTLSWWRDPGIQSRLYTIGTLTWIGDMSVNLTYPFASDADDFYSDTLPYYVRAVYYIAPTIVMVIPSLMNRYKKWRYGNKPAGDEADEETEKLIETLEKEDEIKEVFNKHPELRKKILTKMNEYHHSGNFVPVNILINFFYITFRALHGSLIIMEQYELANRDTNTKITDWTDYISNVLNLVYMSAMMYHSYSNRKKPYKITKKPTLDREMTVSNHGLFAKKEDYQSLDDSDQAKVKILTA